MLLEVVEYKIKRRKNARRGHPSIERGTIIYLIQYQDKRVFHYAYMKKDDANLVKDRMLMNIDDPLIAWNFINDPEATKQVFQITA